MPVKAIIAVYFLESLWTRLLKHEHVCTEVIETRSEFGDIIERTSELIRLISSYEKHRDGIQKHLNEFHTELVGSLEVYNAYIKSRLC